MNVDDSHHNDHRIVHGWWWSSRVFKELEFLIAHLVRCVLSVCPNCSSISLHTSSIATYRFAQTALLNCSPIYRIKNWNISLHTSADASYRFAQTAQMKTRLVFVLIIQSALFRNTLNPTFGSDGHKWFLWSDSHTQQKFLKNKHCQRHNSP